MTKCLVISVPFSGWVSLHVFPYFSLQFRNSMKPTDANYNNDKQ